MKDKYKKSIFFFSIFFLLFFINIKVVAASLTSTTVKCTCANLHYPVLVEVEPGGNVDCAAKCGEATARANADAGNESSVSSSPAAVNKPSINAPSEPECGPGVGRTEEGACETSAPVPASVSSFTTEPECGPGVGRTEEGACELSPSNPVSSSGAYPSGGSSSNVLDLGGGMSPLNGGGISGGGLGGNAISGYLDEIAGATRLPSASGGIAGVLNNFLQWILRIFGILAILAFIISGVMYLTAAGEVPRIDKAKTAMKWSIVGIVIGLGGLIIILTINDLLNIAI